MSARDERDLGIAALGACGLSLVLARLNEPNRALWHAAALGFGAFGAWKLGQAGLDGFAESFTDLPSRLLARLRGTPAPEHVVAVAANPPPAAPNPTATHTGPAVVGRFLDPVDGGSVDTSPWTSAYPVLLEVQNVGDESLEGPVELELEEVPLIGAGGRWSQVGAQRFTLAPGTRRLVTLNVEQRSTFSPTSTVRATARFAGHWLQTASWTLE